MQKRTIIIAAAVAVCVIVVLIVTMSVRSCSDSRTGHSATSDVTTAVQTAGATARIESQILRGSYDLDANDLLAVPGSTSVVAFDLGDGSPSVSEDALQDIRDAINGIDYDCECGFVFVNLGTGHGIAYQADETMYIASAAKAPLIYYALTHGAGSDEETRANIEDAIVYSDNDAYESFAYDYTDEEYAEWLAAHGVDHDSYSEDLYPSMCARSLASFWAEITQYLQEGSSDALWFGSLLSRTETSFIRDALEGSGATILNKGGWNADEGFESVTDAAIIQTATDAYLMVVVSNQADGGDTETSVTTLAKALFAVRDAL